MKNQKLGCQQIAALPLRLNAAGELEVMLITSRETQRWVIPKGWPMSGRSDRKAAAKEAVQEAGLHGDIDAEPLGAFTYFKRCEDHFSMIDVTVYPLWVNRQSTTFKEVGQREELWTTPRKAALMVQEPGLKLILESPIPLPRRLAS